MVFFNNNMNLIIQHEDYIWSWGLRNLINEGRRRRKRMEVDKNRVREE